MFMNFFYPLLCLVKKEFLAVLKDKMSRTVLIFPTLVQAFLFGYVATFDITVVNYVYIDKDHSKESRELKSMLDGSGFFKEVDVEGSFNKAQKLLNDQEVLLIISVDNTFAKKIAKSEVSQIQVIVDGRNSTTAATATAYVNNIIATFSARYAKSNINLDIRSRNLYNVNAITQWNILPALVATLSMIQTVMLSALSVAREREKGSFEQLLVTPLSSTQLLIGKALPPIIVGLVLSLVILFFAKFWFVVPMQGSFLSLYIGMTAFCISIVGVGLSISAIARNMQQAMLYAFVFLVPVVLLSGLMSPISNMPEAWQYANFCNPLRYAVDITRRVYLEGADFMDLMHDIIPLLIISLVTLPLAGYLFRNKTN